MTALLPGHGSIREEWLARHVESPLAPEIRILDPHHHLFDPHYLTAEFEDDLDAVEEVAATIFVECGQHYRTAGPVPERPAGETEFAAGLARTAGRNGLAAAIVGHADLTLGADVEAALAAHFAVADGRFRGVRHLSAFDPDPAVTRPVSRPEPGLLGRNEFRRGFAVLARLGLTFDAWCYHPQIPEVTELAQAFPDVPIVLDHLGGPLGIGTYATARDQVFRDWSASMADLSRRENVQVKLGGLGMRSMGQQLGVAAEPPSSERLATVMRPWVETAVELFGAERCMFESNFPVDKASYAYRTFWNACKRLTAGSSEPERAALFGGTAARVYRVPWD
ncbi:amidohydrolase family protein [Amycolatopsis jejuensis]|uniref:amidohydrolase family protein n=1 Tax=Amycolatopsis jejuensis TaxID=330084 RepID=UPI000524D291|nr:amidohydrolase family protein [Amycolatopsis jejuensis]